MRLPQARWLVYVDLFQGKSIYKWMITRGKPIAGWFISGKIPNRKWMITRGTPMTQETSVWYNKNTV